jgi:cation diffusion facilitator CzcD-associated flavoprotein CzcO
MTGRLREPRIAIIGAGMSGIGLGALLLEAGVTTFTVFEKASTVGGTWRENTYPGVACDVPSRFYQYTFARNPDWSRSMSPGAEIRDYLEDVADRFGVTERIRFGTEVVRAVWYDDTWRVESRDDAGITTEVFDFVVSATGVLHHPRYPDIPGLDTFAGPAFHSARWDHGVSLGDKRIGLIGTGSTGAQIVCDLAGKVEELLVFQRTPHWIIQMKNREVSGWNKSLHRRFPAYDRFTYDFNRRFIESFSPALLHPGLARRFGTWFIKRQLNRVKDPDLRRRLTPDFKPMCRRLVVSTSYYDAIQHPGVDVITTGIERVVPEGVVTTDGTLHQCDVLVLATGFDAHAYLRPIELVGPDGRTLEDAWADGPRAYRTVAMPGFPNLFLFMGPNSPVGNYSLIAIAETQAGFMLDWIERWRRGEVDAMAPTDEATDAFYAEVDAAMPDTIWASGCTSWYVGANGRVELFPWAPQRHREMLAEIEDADFATSLRSRSS